ncbi:MAG: PAS domain-containing hybrid sensor histidine kinase/response regulator, partial [Alphaproteobacteria bacterium]|nr:PAS domain-containing hybrid sensor histidine kinase/response regulator [Alphaproteobacteria bacterium]
MFLPSIDLIVLLSIMFPAVLLMGLWWWVRRLESRQTLHNPDAYLEVFDHAGIGLCRIDAEGRWQTANLSAASMLGYASLDDFLAAQPDLSGQLFRDGDKRTAFFEHLKNIGPVRDVEFVLLKQNGDEIWTNWSGHAEKKKNGDVVFYECTLIDITARKHDTIAMLAAKEQADFANRSKSEFLANMSHELRTPLNAIIGFAEIIKEQMFGPVGQDQYVEYAKDIHDSGQLLLSLINDILDMSKIEAGKRPLSEMNLDIEKIIHACLRLVAARAKAQRLRLTARVPQQMPEIRAEERALKQILTNLLTNAIKFTPEGGSVTMTVGQTPLGGIFFTVEDTGIGIASEDIPVALAPFGQIESALSRKTQGTGLRL